MENSKMTKIFLIIFFFIFILSSLLPFMYVIIPYIRKISPLVWGLIALGIFVIFVIASYNKLVELNKKVKQSKSGIDVYLKQRFDLIPNLVETVKGYCKYEEEVLQKIIKLRQEYDENLKDNMKVNATLNDKYNKLIAVVESYPELKANESFLTLQKQLSKTESQLQAARRIYNLDVTEYNTKVQSFPSNIIAALFKFEESSLFEIDASERENVNIKL